MNFFIRGKLKPLKSVPVGILILDEVDVLDPDVIKLLDARINATQDPNVQVSES